MRRTRLAACGVAAALVVAGCGGSSSGGGGGGHNESSAPPKTELTDAIGALTSGSALTSALSLDTTAANIVHLSAEGGTAPLSQTQAALISGARVDVELKAPSGKTVGQALRTGGLQFAAAGASQGKTYASVVGTNNTLYLQVDLKDLFAAAGQSGQYSTLLARSATLPTFVGAFVQGKPVSLPYSTVATLDSLAQAGSNGQIPPTSALTQFGRQVESTILGDVTVSRTATGTTDQLLVTGNLRQLGRDIISTIAAAFPAASSLSPSQADTAPNLDLKLDASVTGGVLSKAEFDFGQFSPHQRDQLPIAAAFSTSGADISAPSGATPVNLGQLISLLAVADGTSSSSGSATPVPSASAVKSTVAKKHGR